MCSLVFIFFFFYKCCPPYSVLPRKKESYNIGNVCGWEISIFYETMWTTFNLQYKIVYFFVSTFHISLVKQYNFPIFSFRTINVDSHLRAMSIMVRRAFVVSHIMFYSCSNLTTLLNVQHALLAAAITTYKLNISENIGLLPQWEVLVKMCNLFYIE